MITQNSPNTLQETLVKYINYFFVVQMPSLPAVEKIEKCQAYQLYQPQLQQNCEF
jgi:hypothetical protein